MKSIRLHLRNWPALLGSKGFFWFVAGFFVVEALWIALSGAYPLAFDEEVHLGVIRLYAHHISPFWSHQPAGADAFGAVARDPSYLYHYLMSFPYRLIGVFTNNEMAQVIILRILNIGLFAWSLFLFRKVLLKTRAHTAIVNLSLLVFVLVPIAPYLAGQINYDNFILPLTALSLLMAVRVRTSFKEKSIDAASLFKLCIVLLAASLVKYAFLPIAAAIVMYLLVSAYRNKVAVLSLKRGLRQLKRSTLVGLSLVLIVTGGLFVERYGINTLRYHTPVPDCGQVLDYNHCKSYGPWNRDYSLSHSKQNFTPHPLQFNNEWFKGMWRRSFFAISGPRNAYQNYPPMPVPAYSVIIFASLGLVAFLASAKRLWRKYYSPALWLFTVVVLVYIASLRLDAYMSYLQVGKAVAINGRYLLLILPLAVLMTALGVNEVLGGRRRLKGLVAGLVILCLVWGGGVFTFILRSNDSWYWPNSPLKSANHAVQDVLGPVTPGYRPTP